ncbi:MAG: DUF3822 family protein [Porphyromonadaceae bacterium]|nr:DUF3822 family protein [Porphyromonadaceae bacterium]
MKTDFLSFLRPDIAEKYSVSIRLRVDGLCFNIYSDSGELEYEEWFAYPCGVYEEKDAVEEVFYKNPFLAYPYKKVIIYYEPLVYTLVPIQLYDESKGSFWLQAISEEPEVGAEATARRWECYTTELQDNKKLLLSAANKPVIRFLNRQMLVVDPKPYFVDLLLQESKFARECTGRQLSVIIRKNAIDAFIFENGEIVFANKFDLSVALDSEEVIGEIVYYILMIARTQSLDACGDHLRICVDDKRSHDMCQRLLDVASNFFQHCTID